MTPRLTAILAVSRDGAIGQSTSPTGMPWPRLQRDSRRFRDATMGRVCVVGRKTYEGLPRLPGRHLAVLTRDRDRRYPQDRPIYADAWDVGTMLAALTTRGFEDVMVIGGAEVYRALLPRCDRILLTVVERDYPDADVRLDRPGALREGFICLAREYHQPDDANPVAMTFSEWVRP